MPLRKSYHQDDWDELLAFAKFAYNSSISGDLGLSLFEVDLGWKPKSPLDVLTRRECRVQKAAEFETRLKDSLDDAKFS